jgi:hypothetical protein
MAALTSGSQNTAVRSISPRALLWFIALALGEDETNVGAQVTDFGHELIEPLGHASAVRRGLYRPGSWVRVLLLRSWPATMACASALVNGLAWMLR